MRRSTAGDEPVRIVRIIARLNIGGPAIQAITLTKRLEDLGYRTTLVRGVEEPDEGNMDYLAEKLGVQPVKVGWMRRNPSWRDLPALLSLIRVLHRERPHIVHTHAAKGGTLGRVAALLAFPRKASRPILIHTYHGHSLSGYFSPRIAATYRTVEQVLARFTDRLVAVSEEVRDELAGLGVASTSSFEVVPLGFDLSPFQVNGPVRTRMREEMRAELGIPSQMRVVTLIARLVPIKRVDRFLRVANALHDLADVRFLIVGDGELGQELRRSPDARSLGNRLVWAGFRRDMPAVYAASDVVVQTSDNEGTPVSLIEAQAAGIPVVSTQVGGAASVIQEAETGYLTAPDDVPALAYKVRTIVTSMDTASRLGKAGQRRACDNFGLDRLIADIHCMYERSLRHRAKGGRGGPSSWQKTDWVSDGSDSAVT